MNTCMRLCFLMLLLFVQLRSMESQLQLQAMPPEIIQENILPYIGIKSLVQISKVSTVLKNNVEAYCDALETIHLKKVKLLSDRNDQYVECMNQIASYIRSYGIDQKDIAVIYIMIILRYMKKNRYDINKNFIISVHEKKSAAIAIATQGMMLGINFYTWRISDWPLIEACRAKQKMCIKLLLQYGACVDYTHLVYKKNNIGDDEYIEDTALDIAQKSGDPEIIKILHTAQKLSKKTCNLI